MVKKENVSVPRTGKGMWSTHAEEHLHVRVAFDVYAVEVDDGDFFELVRVLVHMEVRSDQKICERSLYKTNSSKSGAYLLKTNHRRSHVFSFASIRT